jgi:RNA polymerase sigma factor (sigma-70 family)
MEHHLIDNIELQQRMLDGDTIAEEQLILRNRPLAVSLVSAYLRRHPQFAHLRDDLIGDAFLKLVKTVKQLKAAGRRETLNPTNYLSRAVRSCIHEAVAMSPTIRIPRHNATVVPKVVSFEFARTLSPQTKWDRSNSPVVDNLLARTKNQHDAASGLSADDASENLFDLRDLIKTCCQTAEETDLVRMLEAGHTHQEIADTVGRPRRTITGHVHAIRDRVYRCLNAS